MDIKSVFSTKNGAGFGVSFLGLLICDVAKKMESASEEEKLYLAHIKAYLTVQQSLLGEVMNSPE
jgi:hypothetical protein